jgi:hypothetical protein
MPAANVSYLIDLQTHMEQRQFDADDRLYLEVKAARYSMQLLCKRRSSSCLLAVVRWR